MTSRKPYDTPTKVDSIDGEVTLNGPDGIGLSMTPGAARETAERLIAAAERAEQQLQAMDAAKNDNRKSRLSDN